MSHLPPFERTLNISLRIGVKLGRVGDGDMRMGLRGVLRTVHLLVGQGCARLGFCLCFGRGSLLGGVLALFLTLLLLALSFFLRALDLG